MYENYKQEVINAGIKLDKYGLIALSGGNITWRMNENHFLITPSGMIYEDMDTDDVLVIDNEGNVIEGNRKMSVDSRALLYILNNRKDLGCVIHTHQPYATGVGLVCDELPCNLTTLANAAHGAVKVVPYVSAACEQMGIDAINYLGDQLAVILKHHGVIGVGKDLNQALRSVVYLEEAAKTYSIAYAMDKNVPVLSNDQVNRAVRIFDYYGQGTDELPEDLR